MPMRCGVFAMVLAMQAGVSWAIPVEAMQESKHALPHATAPQLDSSMTRSGNAKLALEVHRHQFPEAHHREFPPTEAHRNEFPTKVLPPADPSPSMARAGAHNNKAPADTMASPGKSKMSITVAASGEVVSQNALVRTGGQPREPGPDGLVEEAHKDTIKAEAEADSTRVGTEVDTDAAEDSDSDEATKDEDLYDDDEDEDETAAALTQETGSGDGQMHSSSEKGCANSCPDHFHKSGGECHVQNLASHGGESGWRQAHDIPGVSSCAPRVNFGSSVTYASALSYASSCQLTWTACGITEVPPPPPTPQPTPPPTPVNWIFATTAQTEESCDTICGSAGETCEASHFSDSLPFDCNLICDKFNEAGETCGGTVAHQAASWTEAPLMGKPSATWGGWSCYKKSGGSASTCSASTNKWMTGSVRRICPCKPAPTPAPTPATPSPTSPTPFPTPSPTPLAASRSRR